MIITRNLCRQFPAVDRVVHAVDGVDLDIGPGEFVSVMGPSGCGKSTLLHLVGGLDQPTSGTIRIADRQCESLDEAGWARLRRHTIGFVFQTFNLLDDFSVLDNLLLPAVLVGTPASAARRRALALLDRLGAGGRPEASPATLSGGQRQRVAIARALMNDPPVLLADEPTGSLDTEATAEVIGLLRELHAEGRTIVLVTHDPRVATIADRLLTMRDGAIVDETSLSGGLSPISLSDLLER